MKKYYVGGDVSKGYCDFIILDKATKVIEPIFQLDDTSIGYKSLKKILKNHSRDDQTIIFIGFESTGGYENKWIEAIYSFESTMNLKVTRLNPRVSSASEKATLKRNKTDKTSALTIAKYLIRYADEIRYNSDNEWFHLRQRWTYISLLTKYKVHHVNYLEKLLYTYNPTLIQYYRSPISNWLLSVIEKYPTGDNLRKARLKTLAKIPYVTEDKAKILKQNAKINPGLKAKPIEIIISDSVQHIRMSKRNIEKQISDLEQYLPPDQIQILISFIGIDKFSAIGLLIEIGNIDWFELSKQLVAYIGVHPVYGISGDGTYGTFMSKAGRTEAKRILFMVTMSALKSNNDIRFYYLKKLLQGKKPMVALGACMHKTLRTLFAMLKNKTIFSSSIKDTEVKDLEEKLEKIKKKPDINILREIEKKRFYQDFDSTAPISAFQHNKRKDYRSYMVNKK